MTQIISAMRGVPVTLQSAETDGNGIGIAIPNSFHSHKLTIKTSAGVSAGAVQPESALVADYSGTWNPLGGGPITVPAASSELEYNFEGIYSAIRAPISTPIVGGTIDVIYVGS